MSHNAKIFSDDTLLATPNPVLSSTTTGRSDYKRSSPTSQPLEDSLGILSIHSVNLDLTSQSLSDLNPQLRHERSLASESLTRASQIRSLPSRYFRPSNRSQTTWSAETSPPSFSSESTISESDLVPGNASTPRASITDSIPRQSVGHTWTQLSQQLTTGEMDLETALNQFNNTKTKNSFQPVENVVEKLLADELSWKQEKALPAAVDEFSCEDVSNAKQMSLFFKGRSDDLSKFLGKSPDNTKEPVALIDVVGDNVDDTSPERTVSFSTIGRLLSDPQQTPTRALEYLETYNKQLLESASRAPTQRTAPKQSIAKVVIKEPSPRRSSKLHVKDESEARKENIDSLNAKIESKHLPQEETFSTMRSCSSLNNLPNGKLPIECSKIELTWGCVKPGKSASREVIIRNRSSSRIKFKCTLSNPAFKFQRVNAELEFHRSYKIVLQSYESRSLVINFAPVSNGAAVDILNFIAVDSDQQQIKQFIRLFGYGGFGSIKLDNIGYKDTAGKWLLSMGNISTTSTMRKCVTVKNNGTLPCFVIANFTCQGFYSFKNITVTPEGLVLLPQEEKEIVVYYQPKKDDLKHIKSNIKASIIDLGKLTLVTGTEADRGRLRKLCQRAKDKKLKVCQTVSQLAENLPGEVMPTDLGKFKESTSSIKEITHLFNFTDILVILEQDFDDSQTAMFNDETVMYHSLCLENSQNQLDETIKPCCVVEPSTIILRPPVKTEDMIFIGNQKKEVLKYEIRSTPEGLVFEPPYGDIPPLKTAMVTLSYKKMLNEKTVFTVRTLIDNGTCHEVEVKVLPLNSA